MMKNTIAGLAMTVIAGTAMIGSADVAEAGGKKGFHFKFHAPHYKVWHGHKHYYGGGCFWLKKKARRTGKGYWWKRYHRCMDRYYY